MEYSSSIYSIFQFEYVLRERNELDNRVKHDKQVHLQRLASLKEQIHIARLSFAVLVEMLQDDTSLDTEVLLKDYIKYCIFISQIFSAPLHNTYNAVFFIVEYFHLFL